MRWRPVGDAPRVAVIDAKSNTVHQWVQVGGIAFATRPTPDGRWLLVAEASGTKGRVDVIDLSRMTVARSYELAGQPFDLIKVNDRAMAWRGLVSCGCDVLKH